MQYIISALVIGLGFLIFRNDLKWALKREEKIEYRYRKINSVPADEEDYINEMIFCEKCQTNPALN